MTEEQSEDQTTDDPAADASPEAAADTALGLPAADIEPGSDLSEEHAKEFATPWHRDAFIEATQREIDGARIRGDAVQLANAERELARVTGGGQKGAEKRPRGRGKQTR